MESRPWLAERATLQIHQIILTYVVAHMKEYILGPTFSPLTCYGIRTLELGLQPDGKDQCVHDVEVEEHEDISVSRQTGVRLMGGASAKGARNMGFV
jgi:hypothetical protein